MTPPIPRALPSVIMKKPVKRKITPIARAPKDLIEKLKVASMTRSAIVSAKLKAIEIRLPDLPGKRFEKANLERPRKIEKKIIPSMNWP